jgi:hypothetical protein
VTALALFYPVILAYFLVGDNTINIINY